MNDKIFSLPVRIFWEDTDAGGIVYHANYLRYMERARSEMLRSVGFAQQQMKEQGSALIVVANLTIAYRRPARLDDLLTVRTRLLHLRGASVIFEQTIVRDEELIASATVRCATVDAVRGTPVVIPENIYNSLLPFINETAN